jgi:hypothetical protein
MIHQNIHVYIHLIVEKVSVVHMTPAAGNDLIKGGNGLKDIFREQ